MDWLLELVLGVGGIVFGALLLTVLLGSYFLWRSARKLGETT